MNIFELAYKLVGQGQSEAAAGLAAVDEAGQRAAGSLSGAEQAQQRLSAAAAKALPLEQQLNVSLGALAGSAEEAKLRVLELDAGEALWTATTEQATAATTQSAAAVGTFNQFAVQGGRGLMQLDRGFALVAASALGSQRGIAQMALGLSLFAGGTGVALGLLAAVAALGLAYELVTEKDRALTDAQDKLNQSWIDAGLKLTPLAAATAGYADAVARLKADQEVWNNQLERMAKAMAVGNIAGPLGALVAGIGSWVAIMQAGNDAVKQEAAVMASEQAKIDALVKAKQEEINTLNESLRLGTLDQAGRVRLTELLKEIGPLEQQQNLTRAQRNALDQAAQGIRDTELTQNQQRIQTLIELQKLHLLDASGQAELQRAIESLTKAVEAHVGKRKEQLENARLLKAAQDAEKGDAKEAEQALIDRTRILQEQLKLEGATPQVMAATRVAIGQLQAATTDEQRARLEANGLLGVYLELLKTLKGLLTEVAAASEKANAGFFPGARGGFGLGGVSVGEARAHPFGALVPGQATRDLTSPLGAGLLPTFPDSAFAGARDKFVQQTNGIVAAGANALRAGKAELQDSAIDLAKSWGHALRSAFTSAAAAVGDLLGSLFTGRHIDFGKEILAAVGSLFVRMGEAMIAASPIFKALGAAMHNPFTAGPALLAYGAALVALGSALGAIASGGSGAGAPGGGASGASNQPIHVVIVDSATGAATRVPQPIPFVYAPTNIGVTDPGGQAAIARMVQLGQRRNLPSGI